MLFGKECRKIIRSLTYIIYCFIVVLFFITQYFSDCNEREYPPVKMGTTDIRFPKITTL